MRAMHGIAELLVVRGSSIIRAGIDVVGSVAVGAPHALERKRFCVEYGDAPVDVAVGDVKFVRGFVDLKTDGMADVGSRRAVGRCLGGFAQLLDKFSVVGELEQLAV